MKKLIRWVVLAAVAMWVIQDPASAATLAHHALSGLTRAAHSLSTLAAGL